MENRNDQKFPSAQWQNILLVKVKWMVKLWVMWVIFHIRAMDEYTHGFEALKGMRTLRWKPHLGLVEVEVELADRTLSLSVTPTQATAIMHFQEKGTPKGLYTAKQGLAKLLTENCRP